MEKCKFGDPSTVGPVRWFRLVQRVAGRRGLTGLEPRFRIQAVGGRGWFGEFSALDVPDTMSVARWREANASSVQHLCAFEAAFHRTLVFVAEATDQNDCRFVRCMPRKRRNQNTAADHMELLRRSIPVEPYDALRP